VFSGTSINEEYHSDVPSSGSLQITGVAVARARLLPLSSVLKHEELIQKEKNAWNPYLFWPHFFFKLYFSYLL
jgi:hypothetical protein